MRMAGRVWSLALLLTCLAGPGAAAEARPVLVAAACADGATLLQHALASPYGTLWQDQRLARVREGWAEWVSATQAESGMAVERILAEARDIRFAFHGYAEGQPDARVQAELGTYARPFMDIVERARRSQPATVPGAVLARRLGGGRSAPVVALHGQQLVAAIVGEATPVTVTPVEADLDVVVDYPAVMAGIAGLLPAARRAAFEATVIRLTPWLGRARWRCSFTPDGLHDRIDYQADITALLPVDRNLLTRLPTDSLLVAALGIDAAEAWRMIGPEILDGLVPGPRTPASKQEVANTALKRLGIDGLDVLVNGLRGTVVLVVTRGVPHPRVTLIVPRSPVIDLLVGQAIASVGGGAPPAEGAPLELPASRDLPFPTVFARDRSHWVLGTDGACARAWLSAAPAGAIAAPLARDLAAAPAEACVLWSIDMAAMGQIVNGYAALARASGSRDLVASAEMAMVAAEVLGRPGATSWGWAVRRDGVLACEAGGVLGAGMVPAMAASAAATLSLQAGRRAGNEAATVALLRQSILPAQVAYQAEALRDADGDGIGEYATIGELAGRLPGTHGRVAKLLTGPIANGAFANGYAFRIFLPDGADGGLSSDAVARADQPASADAQERHWIIYAWPSGPANGTRMFAMTQEGRVHSKPWNPGESPTWNLALSRGWAGAVDWAEHASGP